jgi:N-terminal half of MaoC dehydratase
MNEDSTLTDIDLNTSAVLTEEVIDLYKAGAAKNRERGPASPAPAKRPWHSAATIDNIRHWSWGIGDDNPLWVDEEYGSSTQYGANLAPPSFFYSTSGGPLHFRSTPSREKGMGGSTRCGSRTRGGGTSRPGSGPHSSTRPSG